MSEKEMSEEKRFVVLSLSANSITAGKNFKIFSEFLSSFYASGLSPGEIIVTYPEAQELKQEIFVLKEAIQSERDKTLGLIEALEFYKKRDEDEYDSRLRSPAAKALREWHGG